MRFPFSKKKQQKKEPPLMLPDDNLQGIKLSSSIKENISRFQQEFSNCLDVIFHNFQAGEREMCLIYIEVLVNKESIETNIIEKMLNIERGGMIYNRSLLTEITKHIITGSEQNITDSFATAVEKILIGYTVLLVDGASGCLMLNTQQWEDRAVQESEVEMVIRGPRDSFNENIQDNLARLRRRIRTPRLKLEEFSIGKYTKTSVVLAYLDGIIDTGTVNEIRQRLDKVKMDGILESSYIEETIRDAPYSPFPTVYHTERPEVIAANLLEGKAAIFVDNTPFVLSVPTTIFEFFQAADDYYQNYLLSSALRILRMLAIIVSLTLPSIYVSVVTVHQEVLQVPLLISIANSREGVPLPTLLEALMMETTFELVREAGLRLPRPVGQAVSIVGVLIIGDAAVSSGLVSPATLMVVAITAITSFVVPGIELAGSVRLLRFPLLLLSGMFGFFGLMVGMLFIALHLNSIRSFGVALLNPFVPSNRAGLKDTVVRVPWFDMITRPLLNRGMTRRQPKENKPKPPKS